MTTERLETCSECGSQLVAVITGWPGHRERGAIEAGQAILGLRDYRASLGPVCLSCEPEWGEVHRLGAQDYKWQVAKETAIAEGDFQRAIELRDAQREARPRLEALVMGLLGRGGSQ